MTEIVEAKIKDPSSGMTVVFEFMPTKMARLALGEMRINGSIIGVLNIPVFEDKAIMAKGEGGRWEAPAIPPSHALSIQESLDKEMARKFSATGEPDIIGWFTTSYEVGAQRTALGTNVVTIFKVDELDAATLSSGDYAAVTFEELEQLFKDAPAEFEGQNILIDIFQAARDKMN